MNPHFKEREVVVSDAKMADEKRKNHAKTLIYQRFSVIGISFCGTIRVDR